MFAGYIVECDQRGLEFKLLGVFVARDPVCSDTDIRMKVLIGPEISCEANLADSVRQIDLQGLEVLLPGFDDGFTQFGTIGDLSVLEFRTEEEEEIAKFSALDDIDQLIVGDNEVD